MHWNRVGIKCQLLSLNSCSSWEMRLSGKQLNKHIQTIFVKHTIITLYNKNIRSNRYSIQPNTCNVSVTVSINKYLQHYLTSIYRINTRVWLYLNIVSERQHRHSGSYNGHPVDSTPSSEPRSPSHQHPLRHQSHMLLSLRLKYCNGYN